ncbi:MAG: hypothetical protein KDD94_11215 [Calditrichaeota bacterium]|nr:hypothetical protein [Calditrichota bacterium]
MAEFTYKGSAETLSFSSAEITAILRCYDDYHRQSSQFGKAFSSQKEIDLLNKLRFESTGQLNSFEIKLISVWLEKALTGNYGAAMVYLPNEAELLEKFDRILADVKANEADYQMTDQELAELKAKMAVDDRRIREHEAEMQAIDEKLGHLHQHNSDIIHYKEEKEKRSFEEKLAATISPLFMSTI